MSMPRRGNRGLRLGLLVGLVAMLGCAAAPGPPATPAAGSTADPGGEPSTTGASPSGSGSSIASSSVTGAPSSEPSATPAAAPSRSRVPVVLLASAAVVTANVGALLLAGAETRYARARELAEETNRSCRREEPRPAASCAELFSAARDTDLMGNLGIGALVTAGVLGAGASVLVLLPARDGATAPQKPSVTAAPWFGAEGGGATVRVSF